MKKIILTIPTLIFLVGCTNQKENQFQTYAIKYYENHMKMINNVDTVTITLEDLKSASTEDEYNLNKLEKCDNTSKITFEVEKTTKNLKNAKIELKC